MALKVNSDKVRSVISAVNEARGIEDINTSTVKTTTTEADLDEVKLLYPGAKYIKNQGDAVVVWVCFTPDTPTSASDFQKLTMLEGYNWEVPCYLSATQPVLTEGVWSELKRPTADTLILAYSV